jgi:TolA-binding protein
MADEKTNPLPDAVRKQVERAQQIVEERGGKRPKHTENPAGDDADPALGSAEQRAETLDQAPFQSETGGQRPEPRAAEPGSEEETWEKRFRGLTTTHQQIKRESERTISELRQMNAGMAHQVEQMQQEIQRMRADAARAAPVPSGPAVSEELRSKLADSFSETEMEAIVSLAGQIADQKTAGLAQSVEMLRGEREAQRREAARQGQQQYRQNMEEGLDGSARGWRAANQDPKFQAFLEQADPRGMGKVRKALFVNAYQNGDVEGVARHFRDFLGQSPNGAPTGDPRQRRVMPRSRGPVPAAASEGKHVWQPGEYQQLVQEKLSKRMSAEEFDRRQRDYFAAIQEGRLAQA